MKLGVKKNGVINGIDVIVMLTKVSAALQSSWKTISVAMTFVID
jgi:hypothetical protein